MSEVVRSIGFEHFRGLPKNDFKLKGRSLVLLGSNGKGKSSFVDGIEFVFSGKVGRFVGTGTGGIDHDDALQHVRKLGEPLVALALNPSNGVISRKLNEATVTIKGKTETKTYFESHPDVDAFILRRARILDFICDQDADRYKKFIQLLGITKVDSLQRCFVEAERQAKETVPLRNTAYAAKLAVFNDPLTKFEPRNLEQVLSRACDLLAEFGLEKFTKWDEAENRLALLKAKRPAANKDQIESLSRASLTLESPLPTVPATDLALANSLRESLETLDASSVDAPRSNLISEGVKYLEKNQAESTCPVCEVPFDRPLESVLLRLKERGEALRELREVTANRRASVGRVLRYAEGVAGQLSKDLNHTALIEAGSKKSLRDARAAALRWARRIKRSETANSAVLLEIPPILPIIAKSRQDAVLFLEGKKAKLLPPDTSKLESAIALLERGILSHAQIAKSAESVASAVEVLRRATVAKEAFSKAREAAVQEIFKQIAATVLKFYQALHDFDDASERSECTELELKPTSRAAAGGLKLAIQFLGLGKSKDPRAFLSEGHLDSLGLCIFLATVRIFNPPGTLLVLDDVLTSIDRDHRRRLGELLFQEFSDFQIVLTTHDEHWNDLLNSSVRAWGVQEKWTFIKVEGWSVDLGPTISEADASWEFITTHLREPGYRELGGPLRLVLEDFLKRTAVKLELKIRFRIDGKYTSGDFVTAGIQDVMRSSLIALAPADEATIRKDVRLSRRPVRPSGRGGQV